MNLAVPALLAGEANAAIIKFNFEMAAVAALTNIFFSHHSTSRHSLHSRSPGV
jgi:hypothetical protein